MTPPDKGEQADTQATPRYHRFRHYPGGWSNFDMIEPCLKPKWCCGCQFNHPFCTESGKVIPPEAGKDSHNR